MKIAVGMSGGVDSSLVAHLLKEQGHEVVGLFMKNWEEDSPHCTTAQDHEDVVLVAEQIGIPCYTSNFSKEYAELVFSRFIKELELGRTPNPDVLCNPLIKFESLLQKAKALGCEKLATGHYARATEDGRLLRGIDPLKDQSYFLHLVGKEKLKQVLFPLGSMTKHEVRKKADELSLATAKKKDSTGICFIGKRNFKEFVSGYLPYRKGPIMTLDQKVVGEHDGSVYFTIGQRKGLGIGGEGDAWFVVKKDLTKNIVYVAQGKEHPALFSKALTTYEPFWVHTPPLLPFRCTAKIRYRQKDEPCLVQPQEDGLLVLFETPQRAITSGQSIVFYDDEECLGGAVIDRAIEQDLF